MATIDLGKIKLVNRGAYNNSTAYTVDDLVQSGGSTYICIQNSTGNAVTNNSYWSVLAQGGTDVGTTITTQGDILYRDGSGLQRLAAGTSGQVLQTGGSGANPSWTAISSDFVRLASLTQTSAVQSFSLDGYFTSDYDIYEIYLVGATAGGNKLQVQINNSGTAQTGSNYVYLGHYVDNSTGNSASNSHIHSNADNQARIAWNDDNDTLRCNAKLTVFDPLGADRYTRVRYESNSYQSSYYYDVVGSFAYHASQGKVISGLTFKGNTSSENVKSDHIYIYGLKNS